MRLPCIVTESERDDWICRTHVAACGGEHLFVPAHGARLHSKILSEEVMTAAELRRARRTLGLSTRQLAAMLAVDADLVRRMEIEPGREGHRPIRSSVERLVQAYLDGYRPPDWPSHIPAREETSSARL
jgi:hypothetical protein